MPHVRMRLGTGFLPARVGAGLELGLPVRDLDVVQGSPYSGLRDSEISSIVQDHHRFSNMAIGNW